MKFDTPVGEINFPRHMMAVALRLLGEPNERLSTPGELRFGTRGSLSVDLEKGRWFDHEANTGGGVLNLIERETGEPVAGGAAAIWFRENILGTADATPVHPARLKCEVETYRYEDEDGKHLFDVVRYEPKNFRQRAADGSWTVKGIRKVLYRLPQIAAAPEGSFVYVVEGEKDVHRLEAKGLIATTNPGGAGRLARRLFSVPHRQERGDRARQRSGGPCSCGQGAGIAPQGRCQVHRASSRRLA